MIVGILILIFLLMLFGRKGFLFIVIGIPLIVMAGADEIGKATNDIVGLGGAVLIFAACVAPVFALALYLDPKLRRDFGPALLRGVLQGIVKEKR